MIEFVQNGAWLFMIPAIAGLASMWKRAGEEVKQEKAQTAVTVQAHK